MSALSTNDQLCACMWSYVCARCQLELPLFYSCFSS